MKDLFRMKWMWYYCTWKEPHVTSHQSDVTFIEEKLWTRINNMTEQEVYLTRFELLSLISYHLFSIFHNKLVTMLFFQVILRNIYRTYTAMSNTKETTNNNIKKHSNIAKKIWTKEKSLSQNMICSSSQKGKQTLLPVAILAQALLPTSSTTPWRLVPLTRTRTLHVRCGYTARAATTDGVVFLREN